MGLSPKMRCIALTKGMVYSTFDPFANQRLPPGSMPSRTWRTAALIVAPWVLILLSWYALAYSGLVNTALLPTPGQVLGKFRELARDRLPMDVWMSTQRVFV